MTYILNDGVGSEDMDNTVDSVTVGLLPQRPIVQSGQTALAVGWILGGPY